MAEVNEKFFECNDCGALLRAEARAGHQNWHMMIKAEIARVGSHLTCTLCYSEVLPHNKVSHDAWHQQVADLINKAGG